MAQPSHRYILKWSQMISPRVKHLAFVREDDAKLPFIAGQFITFHIDAPDKKKILHRSYSIANSPSQNNEVEIACAYVKGGIASELLFNLQPGQAIHASGPFGLFVLKEEEPARYILIATGTGVTPYRSMLDHIQQRLNHYSNLNIVVVQGVRTPEELLFAEEFSHFAASQPNFHFRACYSRSPDQILATHERHGHVQDLFPELNLNPNQDIIYLCGHPNMIDDAFALLTNQGFDRKNVRREKYLFSH